MKRTAHSEYGKLINVLMKPVRSAFLGQSQLEAGWKDHNFLNCPDYDQCLVENAMLEAILKEEGAAVSHFVPDPAVSIDSVYCRDASIQTDAGVILCRMGKHLRAEEPGAARRHYMQAGMKILGEIKAPGTVEGGDVAWLDDKTLAVANAYRTNQSGIDQLTALLQPLGVSVITVDLPHFRGPSDVFHLMSILSPVDKDLAVVYSPLMPVRFRRLLQDRGFDFVEVPESEFDSLGCNVLAIAPRVCLVEQGNPITIQRMRDKGCRVIPFNGANLCVPGGGGPTCLTRPVLREI
ncbi:MAG: dimethylarginine dimethylaminohydrolase family protein [Bacteroidota bacterium]